jgi:hypothetical protein
MSRVWIFSLVLAIAPLTAAEDAPASTPASESAISAAQRDFDAIKAAKDSGVPKGEMPRITVPDLQVGLGESLARPLQSPKDAKAKKAKESANWLIDAMEKKPADQNRTRDAKSGRDRDSVGDADSLNTEKATESGSLDLVQMQTRQESAARAEKDRMETAQAPNAINPLARYMNDWMTRQDYSLLQPVAANTDGPGAGNGISGSAGAVANSVGAPGGLDAIFGSGPVDKSPIAAAPRENPFLQALSLPSLPPASSFAPPPSPLPSLAPMNSTPAYAPMPPPEQPAQRNSVPDFAKPADNDKYFKPLKRF